MELLTIKEVAAFLRLSRSQVYVLTSRGELPHLRIGKRIMVRKTDLMKWIARQMVAETQYLENEINQSYARQQ